eukprot:TRINITY_DN42123_c0_g1_i1.p1 TRINITY_DN42123_c0_g1~~TRINITY_DN42123_c0_g1_i1.p1  ORF type:complete len:831 (+),score=333.13 TRINITY_DN42123_c0_g1_i1:45-2495(+)
MAEARAACHPVPAIGLHSFRVDPALHTTQVAVSSDGFVLYVPHPKFIWRSIRRAVHEIRTQVQTLLWPLRPRLVLAFVGGFSGFVSYQPSSHWLRSGPIAAALWNFDSKVPFTKYLPTPLRVAYLSVNTAAGIILVVVFVQKLFLRLLLSYHGWLTEGRKRSKLTTFWGACLKYGYLNRGLVAGKPLLYAFQYALPSLKPPPVEETVEKFLHTMEPIMEEEEFENLKDEAKDFVDSGVAKQLQTYLWRKSLIARNYVTDWWVQFVYLRGRSSIFINSNFYGIGDGDQETMPSNKQLPRASVLVYYWLIARQLIDRERLPPLCINNLVPLCMDQYRSAFNSVRVPGRETDRIKVWDMDESKHILVIYKGQYYSLVPYTQDTGAMLHPAEILRLLKGIVESHKDTYKPTNIAALTTLDRTKWATIREDYLTDPRTHNRQTLDQVERAMFILNLDDTSPETLTETSHELFLSDGTNRWSDKSFSFVVFKNGKVGIHTEHTWADAPVIAHLFEWVLAMEQRNKGFVYNADGTLQENVEPKGQPKWGDVGWQSKREGEGNKRPLRMPQKLTWTVTESLEGEIKNAVTLARKAMGDLDLVVTEHNAYGKGLVKKMGCSPDAWIQLALQVAYFRDQGRFDLTYESSMTRLFAEGRTETIRSCSVESCAFVRALDDASVDRDEKVRLLKAASDAHTKQSRDCMVGKGVDRHLFAMYVVAVGKEIDAPFVRNALSVPWKLSTSQVPQRQLPPGTWPKGDNGDIYYTPSGGFGPAADDGYGVSYCLCGDTRFFFHVSSKTFATNTDSTRLTKHIHQALEDMAKLKQ